MTLKQEFVDAVREAAGAEAVERFLAALDEPASVSLRLNPAKAAAADMEVLRGATPVAWSSHGYLLPDRPVFTLRPEFHSGAYYVQDSSAMFAGELFRRTIDSLPVPLRPLRVLDLCAAPGGKTTDIAASLRERFGDNFILVSNEVMQMRSRVLADNVARWGDPNVTVTCCDPAAFSQMEGFFDIILADVPCSGEGMFRKDDEAVAQWSPDNVALCSSRQRRIVADAWPALRDGGVMIYSTCTFNRSENGDNVGWICRELGASAVDCGFRAEGVIFDGTGWLLVPGMVPGEGQYCAAVRKDGDAPVSQLKQRKASKAVPLQSVAQRFFTVPVSARMRGDLLVAVPSVIAMDADEVGSCAHVIASGCAVGQVKGRDLVPDEDLALCIALDPQAFPEVPVDVETALKYLHRDTFTLDDAPAGFVLLTCGDIPLGFVKNLGRRCNNLHPQGRRIIMDIK